MRGRRALTALLALVVLASMATPALAASLNYDSGDAPNPMIKADSVELATWKMGWEDATTYENDNGDVVDLPAVVNKTQSTDEAYKTNNPFAITATDIDEEDFGLFPRIGDEDNAASALDASEWTVGGANSSKLSVTDTETAPNVEAVNFDTDGSMASGDVAYADYGNWSSQLDSDESKRFLQLAVDVVQLDSSAHVEVQVRDEDGDYKNVTIDADATESNNDVVANSTGEGDVLQVQLGKLTTRSDADGDGFDNIETLRVQVEDGDAEVSASLINLQKTSPYTFGEERYQADDDSDLETRTYEDPHGQFRVYAMDTFGDTFSDAVFHDLSYPAHFRASDLTKDMDVQFEFKTDNSFPNWDVVANIHYRLELPDAYDLSYSGVTLVQTQQWPEGRYVTAEYKEGVGDTDFADISNWNSYSGQLTSQGTTVTIDDTVSSGTQYGVHLKLTLTDKEANAMQAAGGTVPMQSSSGGGIFGFLTSIPGMVLSLLGGALGIKLMKG